MNTYESAVRIKNLVFKELVGINNTYRFSGQLLIKNQSVAEHSFWVAIISAEIAKFENEARIHFQTVYRNEDFDTNKYYKDKLIANISFKEAFNLKQIDLLKVYPCALFHDVDEVFTGDLNHRFKYFDDSTQSVSFRQMLNDMAKKVMDVKMKDYPSVITEYYNLMKDDSEIKTIVKIADWLQLLQYVRTEKSLGNKNLEEVENRITRLLEQKANESKLLCFDDNRINLIIK